MSEERITKVEVEKDPKRVEAGKRLAEYNKAKRQVREDRTEPTEERNETNTIAILTGVGIIVGLGGLYFKYKQDKREEKTEETEDNAPATKTQRSNHHRSLDD